MAKYLHIFPDEKSVDYVIENCENLAPGEHIYAVRNAGTPFKHVKSSLAKPSSLEQLKQLGQQSDIAHIYLHFLKEDAVDFVLQYQGKASLTWIFWGADGYILPTLEALSVLPASKRIDTKARNPFYLLGLKKILVKRKNSNEVKKLQQALNKISYCATWVSGDIDLIKPYAPHIKPINFSNYSIHQLVDTSINLEPQAGNFVFLGNSGYAPNNHLEAVDFLTHKGWNGTILAPMSYGNKHYIKAVKKEISKSSNKLNTLENFLSKEEYHKVLGAAKLVFLNHTRQQAAGNALAALWYGIPLLMNSKSSLAKTFKNWGLNFSLDSEITTLQEVSASKEIQEKNKLILEQQLGNSTLEQMYKDLLFLN